jgi:hypothetical protein
MERLLSESSTEMSFSQSVRKRPIEMTCRCSAEEAVARLRRQIKCDSIVEYALGQFSERVVGYVSEEAIHIWRIGPPIEVPWKPHFYGRLENSRGNARLVGVFRFAGSGRAILSVWTASLVILAVCGMILDPMAPKSVIVPGIAGMILMAWAGGLCASRLRKGDPWKLIVFLRRNLRA